MRGIGDFQGKASGPVASELLDEESTPGDYTLLSQDNGRRGQIKGVWPRSGADGKQHQSWMQARIVAFVNRTAELILLNTSVNGIVGLFFGSWLVTHI